MVISSNYVPKDSDSNALGLLSRETKIKMQAEMEIDEGEVDNGDEIQKIKRKRRFSEVAEGPSAASKNGDCALQSAPSDDAGAGCCVGDVLHGAPAKKYREVDADLAFRLVDFSDEVLFEIFKNLDCWSLLALMNTCERFRGLVCDQGFWDEIDLSGAPLPLGVLEEVLDRSSVKTKIIKLYGPQQVQPEDSEIRQFNNALTGSLCVRTKHLQILHLRGVTIDFRTARIRDFPPTLQCLMFQDCNARMPECPKTIFAHLESTMPFLEKLAIEYCDWFDPYYLVAFSKMPELKSLSLKGCQTLVEFIPYGSMGARFGFKRLEHLDMRFTPITDSDLQCFNAVLTLKEILLDCPESLRRDAEERERQTAESASDDCQPSTSAAAAMANSESAASSATSQLNVTISLPSSLYSRLRREYSSSSSSSLSTSSSSSSSTSSSSSSPSLPSLASPEAAGSELHSPDEEGAVAPPPLPAEQPPFFPQRSFVNALLENRAANGSAPTTPATVANAISTSTPLHAVSAIADMLANARGSGFAGLFARAAAASSSSRKDRAEKPMNCTTSGSSAESDAGKADLPSVSVKELADLHNEAEVVCAGRPPTNVEAQQPHSNAEPQLPAAVDHVQPPELPRTEAAVDLIAAGRPPQLPRAEAVVDMIAADRPPQSPPAEVPVDAAAEPVPLDQPRAHVVQRADQHFIYLDLLNRRRLPHHAPLRPAQRNHNHLEQVFNHPLFWNVIDPTGQNNAPNAEADAAAAPPENGIANAARGGSRCLLFPRFPRAPWPQRPRNPISDRGICCFGRPQNPVEQGVIWIRIGNRPSENRFERLSVRNYHLVTDISLQHLVQCSPHLVYLDLTGTSVTREGVQQFLALKPHCVVVADHLNSDKEDSVKDDSVKDNPEPPPN